TVAMFERPFENERDDFHIAMSVHAKPLPRLNAVLVNHTERAKSHVPLVAIIAERKRVKRVQPPMIKMPPLAPPANPNHVISPAPSTRVGQAVPDANANGPFVRSVVRHSL